MSTVLLLLPSQMPLKLTSLGRSCNAASRTTTFLESSCLISYVKVINYSSLLSTQLSQEINT